MSYDSWKYMVYAHPVYYYIHLYTYHIFMIRHISISRHMFWIIATCFLDVRSCCVVRVLIEDSLCNVFIYLGTPRRNTFSRAAITPMAPLIWTMSKNCAIGIAKMRMPLRPDWKSVGRASPSKLRKRCRVSPQSTNKKTERPRNKYKTVKSFVLKCWYVLSCSRVNEIYVYILYIHILVFYTTKFPNTLMSGVWG